MIATLTEGLDSAVHSLDVPRAADAPLAAAVVDATTSDLVHLTIAGQDDLSMPATSPSTAPSTGFSNLVEAGDPSTATGVVVGGVGTPSTGDDGAVLGSNSYTGATPVSAGTLATGSAPTTTVTLSAGAG